MDVEIFNLCDQIFIYFGLRRDKSRSLKFFIIANIVRIFVVDMFLIGSFIELARTTDFQERIEVFSVSIICAIIYVHLANYLWNYQKIEILRRKLFEICEFSYDERFKDRKSIGRPLKMIRYIMKAIVASDFCIGIFAIIAIIFYKKLPYKIYYVFEIETSIIGFTVAVINQVMVIFYAAVMLMLMVMFPPIYFTHASGLLTELGLRLEMTGRIEDMNENYNEFIKCMEIHTQIGRFVIDVKEAFKVGIFSHCLIGSLAICTVIFSVTIADNLSTKFQGISYLALVLLEIFIFCIVGQELEDSSMKLLHILFHSSWYKADMKTRKTVKGFMENLKKPMKIRLFGFLDVNLVLFGRIMNSAYSLFAVLQKIMQ